jgi:hypothetical protein
LKNKHYIKKTERTLCHHEASFSAVAAMNIQLIFLPSLVSFDNSGLREDDLNV